jgi:hypothetical protein
MLSFTMSQLCIQGKKKLVNVKTGLDTVKKTKIVSRIRTPGAQSVTSRCTNWVSRLMNTRIIGEMSKITDFDTIESLGCKTR